MAKVMGWLIELAHGTVGLLGPGGQVCHGHGATGPSARKGPWANGPMGPWAHGLMGPWVAGGQATKNWLGVQVPTRGPPAQYKPCR